MWPSYKENPVGHVLASLLLLMLVVFVGLKARNSALEYRYIGKPSTVRDTITIEGDGKVTAQPNVAMIDLGVYMEGTDLATVQRQHTQKVNAINAAVKQNGISEKDIQTSQYNIAPKMDYNNGTSRVSGYTISQSIQVKVRDLTKIGAVLTQATQLGANQVGGISFTIDDPNELKQEARAKALQRAKEKAEILARDLNVDLGRVVSFSENANTPGMPMPMYRTMAADSAMGGAAPSPEIQAGSLDVTSNVSVTYEIR